MTTNQKNISIRVFPRKLNSGKTSFSLDITVNGVRTRETLNLVTTKGKKSPEYISMKEEAEAIAVLRRKDLRQNKYGIEAVAPEDRTVHEYFQSFTNNYSKADLNRTKAVNKRVKQFFSPKLTLQALTKEECEEFSKTFSKELKKETARNYWQTLSVCCTKR